MIYTIVHLQVMFSELLKNYTSFHLLRFTQSRLDIYLYQPNIKATRDRPN